MRIVGTWVLAAVGAALMVGAGCGGSSEDDDQGGSDAGRGGGGAGGGASGRGGTNDGGASEGGQPDGGVSGDAGASAGGSRGGSPNGGTSAGGSSGEAGSGGEGECINSLDCPQGLVCDRDSARCVECVQDGDCAAGERCGLNECRPACTSDNQCTSLGLLCDLDGGYCVECLSHLDCPEARYCENATCVADVCTGGATRCEASGVATCNSFGSDWGSPRACASRQSCREESPETAACEPWICEPSSTTCDDDRVTECSSDGLSSSTTLDCADDGRVCAGGACHDVVCEAGVRFCDAAEVRQCSARGESSELVQTCSGGQPVCHPSLAACVARVCLPDEPSCDRNVATTCNATGTGFAGTRTNCRQIDQYCDDGDCAACAGAWGNVCSELPRFRAAQQIVDGAGDEFCDVPAISGRVAELPWLHPTYRNTTLTATYALRAAWSDQAFHAHVKITKASVNGYSYPNNDFWRGDTVQFYVAGGGTLTGAFGTTQDGGARHLTIAAPSTSYPNGRGAYQTSSTSGSYSAADAAHYRAVLTADGYEVEVRIPWQPNAAPRTSGARFGFDFSATVNDTGAATSASTPGLEGVLNNPLPSSGTCAHPYCDDRAWCLPFLE